MTAIAPPVEPLRSPAFRAWSAVEFLAGAGIVLGHNIFRVVPNEVIVLTLLGLLSIRLRNGSFAALGFRRPESWRALILIALAAVALRIVLGDFVIEPLTSTFWPAPKEPEIASGVEGNLAQAGLLLLLVWTFAAFGEEIAYRGYLVRRAAEACGGSTLAWWIGVVLVAALFGFGHFYKGPAGVLDSGVAGLILGAAYLLAGRNLWACVLAHGFIDTTGIAFLYFGWE